MRLTTGSRSGPATIVVTGDILFADRCIKSGATVIDHNGPFTAASIGGLNCIRRAMRRREGGDRSARAAIHPLRLLDTSASCRVRGVVWICISSLALCPNAWCKPDIRGLREPQ
jgi:hypothetical protein